MIGGKQANKVSLVLYTTGDTRKVGSQLQTAFEILPSLLNPNRSSSLARRSSSLTVSNLSCVVSERWKKEVEVARSSVSYLRIEKICRRSHRGTGGTGAEEKKESFLVTPSFSKEAEKEKRKAKDSFRSMCHSSGCFLSRQPHLAAGFSYR